MPCPLVSVIIPTYNSEKFLTSAIQSVLEQTFKDLEIIVIDDGSATFKCQEITKDFQKSSSLPIHYFYQENKGPAAARNYGIKQAKGEFISFLDSDDIYEPSKLIIQTQLLRSLSPDYALVCGGTMRFQESNTKKSNFIIPPKIDGNAYQALLAGDIWLRTSSGSLFRKSALQAIGGYNESLYYGEDMNLLLAIAQKYKIKTHSDIVYRERHHKNSLTKTNHRQALEHNLKSIEEIVKRDPEIPKLLIERKKQRAYFGAASQFLFVDQNYKDFCYYLQEGVKLYGNPPTVRGWLAFLLSKSWFFGKIFFYLFTTIQKSLTLTLTKKNI